MKRKTHDEFVNELRGRNIIALEHYVNCRTKILFRCMLDGYEWRVTPREILLGHGCTRCQGRNNAIRKTRGNRIIGQLNGGKYLVIDVSTKSFPDAAMLVDCHVWEKVLADGVYGKWFAVSSGNTIYAFANVKNTSGKTVQFHKLVCPGFDLVDHENMNGLDNRIENLRECTRGQNAINARLKSTNTSGFTGVWLSRSRKLWNAEIKVDRKKIHLGTFKKKEDAINARKAAEVKYFGEFSRFA